MPVESVDAEEVGMSTERVARIAPAMQSYVDSGAVPGILTAVARHGKPVHLQAFGYRDAEQLQSLRPDAIFRLASMTNPITIKHLLTPAGMPYYVSDDEVGMAMRREGLTGVHARVGEFNLEQYVKRLAAFR